MSHTNQNRKLKTGKNPEGKSYAYMRSVAKQRNDAAREWIRDQMGIECSVCGFQDSGWAEPKPNGEVKSLTLYHFTFDLSRHRYDIESHGGSGENCWGVNLYRWLHQKHKAGLNLLGLFRLICNDCKRDKGLG